MFGTAGPTPTLASAEEGGKKLVTELGAPSIAALRDMPAAQIMAHVGRKFAAYGLQPVIDGWVLPRNTPEAIATGQQNGTELLLGSAANEGTQLLSPTTPEALRATIKQWFGTQAEPIVALYTGTDPDTATVAQDQLHERLRRRDGPGHGGSVRAAGTSRVGLQLQPGGTRLRPG